MSVPNPSAGQSRDQEASRFYEMLKANDQIRDVDAGEDTSKLPAHVTHVRIRQDGTIKRIRFTGVPHR
jgi:hypothetical protein